MGGIGNLLGSLFGQGATEQDYQRFDQGYAGGRHQDLDDYEVQQRYRQVLRNAPPDVLDDAHTQAFSQLSPQQRMQLAQQLQQQSAQMGHPYGSPYDRFDQDVDPRYLGQMARQAEQRNPGILDQIFGGQPGPLNNPLVKMAMAGAAAMAARRFLGGQMDSPFGGGGMMGGNAMGGLGGLMGNQLGGDPSAGYEDQNSSGGNYGGSGGNFGGTEV
jgi:hypothetical protein